MLCSGNMVESASANTCLISQPQLMSHANDYAFAPLIAVLADYHKTLLPEGLLDDLTTVPDEHTYEAQAYYPPFDLETRNITTWVSENITIGAESFRQNVIGGPTQSQTQWSPAVVQWSRPKQVAFLSVSNTLHPSLCVSAYMPSGMYLCVGPSLCLAVTYAHQTRVPSPAGQGGRDGKHNKGNGSNVLLLALFYRNGSGR